MIIELRHNPNTFNQLVRILEYDIKGGNILLWTIDRRILKGCFDRNTLQSTESTLLFYTKFLATITVMNYTKESLLIELFRRLLIDLGEEPMIEILNFNNADETITQQPQNLFYIELDEFLQQITE